MRAFFAVLLLALPFGTALQAQDAPNGLASPPAADALPRDGSGTPPAKGPDIKGNGGPSLEALNAEPDRVKRLDALFAALKVAPDKDSAKSIAERIDVALAPSGSDTADLLMGRAALALQAKDFDLTIQLLDGAIAVAPDHLEAWNKRATVFYLKQDYSDALRDLQQVVAREPRHYGAWSGIAIIAKEIGDEKHALDAARRALAVYPRFEQAKDIEETLTITVEGRPI